VEKVAAADLTLEDPEAAVEMEDLVSLIIQMVPELSP
tara:strand:+ start:22 stop:132 length:111 start_codon:yes stop_codon:yes gene_type:complete